MMELVVLCGGFFLFKFRTFIRLLSTETENKTKTKKVTNGISKPNWQCLCGIACMHKPAHHTHMLCDFAQNNTQMCICCNFSVISMFFFIAADIHDSHGAVLVLAMLLLTSSQFFMCVNCKP